MSGRAERVGIDVRSKRQHRDRAPHQVFDPLIDAGLTQLQDRKIERLLARDSAAGRPENRMNLSPKKQVATLDQDAFHPASFRVR